MAYVLITNPTNKSFGMIAKLFERYSSYIAVKFPDDHKDYVYNESVKFLYCVESTVQVGDYVLHKNSCQYGLVEKINGSTCTIRHQEGRYLCEDMDYLLVITNLPEQFKVTAEPQKEKETKTMKKNLFGNMSTKLMEQFMPQKVEGDEVGLSFTGAIVVKRANGDYVRYDSAQNKIVNDMQLAVAGDGISKMIFLMPTTDVKKGDVIKNNETYHYVVDIAQDGKLVTVSLNSGRKSSLVDEVNTILGKKMYKKVTSLFTMSGDSAMNPMMMAMFMSEDNEDGLFQMLAMSSMMTGQGQQLSPMMMALMLGGEDKSDMMSLMLMSQMMSGANPFAPAKVEGK